VREAQKGSNLFIERQFNISRSLLFLRNTGNQLPVPPCQTLPIDRISHKSLKIMRNPDGSKNNNIFNHFLFTPPYCQPNSVSAAAGAETQTG